MGQWILENTHLERSMSYHVLLVVALLSERLPADLALVGLDLLVHAHVVQQVPGLSELLVAAAVLASVVETRLAAVLVDVVDLLVPVGL